MTTPDAVSARWLESFWRTFYARRPVDATFIGRGDHDHDLPDLGEEGVGETLVEMGRLLAEAPSPAVGGVRSRGGGGVSPVPGGAPLEALDRRIIEGFLRIQIQEHQSRHLVANPSVHVGEAVFGMMSLLLPNRPATEHRIDALRARMEALPGFFDRAREVVRGAPAAWIRRASRECRGGVAFAREGIEELGAEVVSALGAAPERAALALEGFRAFLERDVEPSSPEGVACGPETFDLYLRQGHFLDRSADEIVAYARDELARVRSELEASASSLGAGTPEGVMALLADAHPGPDEYYARYRETWEAMRAVARDQRLLTWPDFPLRYAPRPGWARAAAPDLYFLFYRSPAAFDRPEVHDYLVAPLDTSLAPAEREAFLRANNDSVIKLNHVVHHGGIGHHVQNWHAFRSPLSVGRVAAVDGASRIAMFCGGTMAEGWACYATDLMAEAGALTPLERYAERYARTRMCARAIVDVEVHHGRMGLDEATRFYRERAGMAPAAAESEAVKNSMFPGTALMYLVGTDAIHELRGDLMRRSGGALELAVFHDAFLSYGSIPVALIAREMKRRAALGVPLGAHDALDAAVPPNGGDPVE